MQTSASSPLLLRIEPQNFHAFRTALMQAYGICEALKSGLAVKVGDGINIAAVVETLGQLIDGFDEQEG